MTKVPKVHKICISANQGIRVQDIRESGYQEKKQSKPDILVT